MRGGGPKSLTTFFLDGEVRCSVWWCSGVHGGGTAEWPCGVFQVDGCDKSRVCPHHSSSHHSSSPDNIFHLIPQFHIFNLHACIPTLQSFSASER